MKMKKSVLVVAIDNIRSVAISMGEIMKSAPAFLNFSLEFAPSALVITFIFLFKTFALRVTNRFSASVDSTETSIFAFVISACINISSVVASPSINIRFLSIFVFALPQVREKQEVWIR